MIRDVGRDKLWVSFCSMLVSVSCFVCQGSRPRRCRMCEGDVGGKVDFGGYLGGGGRG